jgi:hypothetical protein
MKQWQHQIDVQVGRGKQITEAHEPCKSAIPEHQNTKHLFLQMPRHRAFYSFFKLQPLQVVSAFAKHRYHVQCPLSGVKTVQIGSDRGVG